MHATVIFIEPKLFLWMDAVELNGILMTDSPFTPNLCRLKIFFYNNAISARAPPAGVFGGRKQEDNRG